MGLRRKQLDPSSFLSPTPFPTKHFSQPFSLLFSSFFLFFFIFPKIITTKHIGKVRLVRDEIEMIENMGEKSEEKTNFMWWEGRIQNWCAQVFSPPGPPKWSLPIWKKKNRGREIVTINDWTIFPPFFCGRLASFCFFFFFGQYILFYVLDLLVFFSFSFVFYLFIYFVLLLSYVLDLFLSYNIFLCVLYMYTGSFVLLFFYLCYVVRGRG